MARLKFFGSNIEPACGYCKKGRANSDDSMIICKNKGIVEAFFSCKNFEYDPLKRIPSPQATLPTYSNEDFML